MAESAQVRKQFIDFRATWDGVINRADLTSHFSISVPQASLDLQHYLQDASEALVYDTRAKRYEAREGFTPSLIPFDSAEFFTQLRKQAAGEKSWLGFSCPVDEPPQISRAIAPEICQKVVRAIRNNASLAIRYQSLRQITPEKLVIEPHAFGSDGFRWHARAYVREESSFRDFVLSRVLECRSLDAAIADPKDDQIWNSWITVKLRPNQNLSPEHCSAIAREYDMKGGTLSIKVRHALLAYFLTEHRLDFDPDEKIEKAVHKLEVINVREVEAALAHAGFKTKKAGRGLNIAPTF